MRTDRSTTRFVGVEAYGTLSMFAGSVRANGVANMCGPSSQPNSTCFASSLPVAEVSWRTGHVGRQLSTRRIPGAQPAPPHRTRLRRVVLNATLATSSDRPGDSSRTEDEVEKPASEEGDVSEGDPVDAQSEDETAGVQGAIDNVVRFVNESFDQVVWPVLGSCNVLSENWERDGGNFILRPPSRAKAVLHFVGGAFVGAAPHIAYCTLLSRLARRGYCVVATPYDLALNYLETTADIMSKWEAIEGDLAREYGAIPVIGVGHSAGAVFHSLAASLFEDTSPKAGLVLVSFNNKDIKSAIPLYDALVTPLAKQAVAVENGLPENIRSSVLGIPSTIDSALESGLFTPKKLREVVVPVVKEGRRVVEQLGPLVRELGGVSRSDSETGSGVALTEFYPPPSDIAAAVASTFSVEQTLVVKFGSDLIDESEDLLANVRRRGNAVEVSMIELDGNHLTPLVQDLPSLNGNNDDSVPGRGLDPLGEIASGAREALSAFGTKEMYTLESLIDEWILSGISEEVL